MPGFKMPSPVFRSSSLRHLQHLPRKCQDRTGSTNQYRWSGWTLTKLKLGADGPQLADCTHPASEPKAALGTMGEQSDFDQPRRSLKWNPFTPGNPGTKAS